MLVFISDIHLTDGSSGETIKPKAFKKFVKYLGDMAESATAKSVDIVLLGDIFDVIRSGQWLKSQIRPWSTTDDKDSDQKGVKEYAVDIVSRICSNAANTESIKYLTDFQKESSAKGLEVNFKYIIGNHDWLINRYSETRKQIINLLGLNHNPADEFPTECFFQDYKVFARHGDIYDPFNYDGDRNSASVGDAIVIELLNKLAKAVEDEIGVLTDPNLVAQLKEIDNIRPLTDIPAWIESACLKALKVEYAEKVKVVWNRLVDDFLAIPFVKSHDKSWRVDIVDMLQAGLKITKGLSFGRLAKLGIEAFITTKDDYIDRAMNEPHVVRNEAEHIVYGHTHEYKIQPLDLVPMPGYLLKKTYYNSGTWRKIHVRNIADKKNHEFTSWHVMTFIAFYLDPERKNKVFEVWNGALG